MKTKIKNILFPTSATLGYLPIRIGVGVVMIAHGAQKLFGWFGGHGLQATGQYFAENLNLKPGLFMALFAGGVEFFGGLLLVLGLLTRVASAAIAFTMAVAIVTTKIGAFFASNGGLEYPLVLMLASVGLVLGGGGRFSIDREIIGRARGSV